MADTAGILVAAITRSESGSAVRSTRASEMLPTLLALMDITVSGCLLTDLVLVFAPMIV
jgi:hypothetical protein